jgi:ketosteroid isomerase-like protein
VSSANVELVRSIFATWAPGDSSTEWADPEIEWVVADGPDKGRASGIEGDDRYYQLFTFRGGKIVRMEVIRDEAEALEAVGLSE